MDDKNGPASHAATAYAETPLAPAAGTPITNPNAPVSGAQSGVNPTGAVQSASGAQPTQGPIGRTIKGRYRIKRLLGEGGMGGVYEGEHLEIGKRVAIKLVHSLHARDPHIAARMKQEARSTGSLESENIVQVFDAGEDEELGLFLVMELLKGEDLATLLVRKKRLSPMAASTLVIQAAQGLARAHAAGIVHRDLKPANVFVCTRDDGSSLVKLVDFGIAKLVRDANAAGQQAAGGGLTRMGMVIGTPQYMSPEQAQGLPSVDHRTDIYSLGAILFECICGASPYPEMPTYEQTILQIMTRPAPRISQVVPDVPPELDQLCAEMMMHDPNARPRDMSVVRERLARIFPTMDGGRLPMRSLTNEVGLDATIAAGASGDYRAMVDAARAALPPSGVGIAMPRPPNSAPGTGPAVAVDSTGRFQVDEPVGDVAGVPQRRSNGVVIGVVAALAVAIGIAGAAIVKMRSASSGDAAPAGYGLVQSTVATPAATQAAPAATAPAAVAQAAKSDAPVIAVPDPAAVAATSEGRHGKHAKPGHEGQGKGASASAASPTPAPAAPAPARESKENKASKDRPVGGTTAADEF